eukprot:1726335-Ditylum_brightwellii.AAC.1
MLYKVEEEPSTASSGPHESETSGKLSGPSSGKLSGPSNPIPIEDDLGETGSAPITQKIVGSFMEGYNSKAPSGSKAPTVGSKAPTVGSKAAVGSMAPSKKFQPIPEADSRESGLTESTTGASEDQESYISENEDDEELPDSDHISIAKSRKSVAISTVNRAKGGASVMGKSQMGKSQMGNNSNGSKNGSSGSDNSKSWHSAVLSYFSGQKPEDQPNNELLNKSGSYASSLGESSVDDESTQIYARSRQNSFSTFGEQSTLGESTYADESIAERSSYTFNTLSTGRSSHPHFGRFQG